MLIEPSTLARMHALRIAARSAPDWKSAFGILLSEIRSEFVFDNEALYLLDARRRNLEVVHARAAGRGRSREADINWGEALAGEVSWHTTRPSSARRLPRRTRPSEAVRS